MGSTSNRLAYVLKAVSGPAVFLVFALVPVGNMDYSMRGSVGILLWMLLWWVLQPIPAAATALLPIVAASIFKLGDLNSVLSKYFSATIVLLIGANIITLAWRKWGFDKRLSLWILLRVGTNPKKLIAIWFILSVILSSLIANAVVAAALFPIVLTTLRAVGVDSEEKVAKSEYAAASLLAVSWGSTVGFGTPLGGAMNLVVIGYIEEMVIHREVMYVSWIAKCLPLVVAVSVPLLLILLTMKLEFKEIPGTKEALQKEYHDLGPMNQGEIWSVFLFVLAMCLAFFRPLFADFLPTVKPEYAFLLVSLVCFLIPVGNEKLVTWQYVQPKLTTGVFFLIGGGTALGGILISSGVGELVAQAIAPIVGVHPFVAALVFSAVCCAFANIMTISGAMSLVQPIIITTLSGIGINPIPFIFIANAAGNISIILPSSSAAPSMASGYGLEPAKMARMGLRAVPLCLASAVVVGYLLYLFWPAFSVM